MQPQARTPAVAGQFYPRSPRDLREVVKDYIASADLEPTPEAVVTVLVPHAGYVYSGPTAGFAYRRMQGKTPGRVVLLGCSHHYRFETASIYDSGTFETPLGDFTVDQPFATALADKVDSYSCEPHMPEHSLEVQLPFLAASVGRVPIVPVLFGSLPNEWHAEVGRILAEMLEPGDLVVISTDLSHYLSDAEAHEADTHALEVLLTQDIDRYLDESHRGTCAMCGAAAVVAGMACAAAQGADRWKVLDYRTSAHASGDTSRVVGYAAVSMERAA